MTTVLFLLAGVLVGYVVYVFYTSEAGSSDLDTPPAESGKKADTPPPPAAAAKPAAKPKPKPVAEKKPAAGKPKKEPAAAAPADPKQYKHPASGEVAAVPSNYRFAKRWIKEALVEEKLLDRVYKNNELDDKASKKVKQALEKFKALEKYHG